jgi:hypothetical protein
LACATAGTVSGSGQMNESRDIPECFNSCMFRLGVKITCTVQ